jgi:uncharacterized protein
MDSATAKMAVDHAFVNAAIGEKIDIGFFGGEPLLEFGLIKEITDIIQSHRSYDAERVTISITTNGTIYNQQIEEFIAEKGIVLCVSCDGPPSMQNKYRHFRDGSGTSAIVEKNLKQALRMFPMIPVNAVYSPDNVASLPEVVEYLTGIGVNNLYLNPNISAHWTKNEAESLRNIFRSIGDKYIEFYRRETPRYINLIDGKVALILRGGYRPLERCRMGHGEFAVAPSGNVYPCERLIGSDDGKEHCLGNINYSFKPEHCPVHPDIAINPECQTCALNDYCMNWCGCTNYFGSGRYDTVSPFICAVEKASINAALKVLDNLGSEPNFILNHRIGVPATNMLESVKK